MRIKFLIVIINILVLFCCRIGFTDDAVKNVEKHAFLKTIKIPFSIGRIFDTNICNNEKPDIIIINDIHCQPYAQKNIYMIIDYICSEVSIDKIFVEGAAKGKINLSAVTDIEKDVREKILDKMLNEGLVNGTEYYCYITNSDLYGIEDSSLYTETLQQAYILIKNEKSFSVKIKKAKQSLNKMKKKYYFKDMFVFENLFFNETNIEPKIYCEQILKISEQNSIDIKKYPELYNFINIINCEVVLVPYVKNYSKDFSFLLQKLKNYAPMKVYVNFVSNYKNKNIEENLVLCYKFTNQFLSEKENEYYKYINLLETKLNFIKMLDIGKYLKEKELFYENVFNKIFKTEMQKQIAFVEQMLFFTDKYVKLNMDFAGFDKFSNDRDKFLQILKDTDFIKNEAEIIDVLQNEELKKYYDNNIKRDKVFFKNIQEQIKDDSINIVTVGGFHKELLNLFDANNKKYIVIFPNAKNNDNKLYKQLILDIGSNYWKQLEN